MTAQFMPVVEEERRIPVSFTSGGVRLAGHFYAARGEADDRAPAVAMAGPMTSVKEETLPHYAAGLQDSGISVLTFDNRNFGESDAPRPQHLDTGEQVEDLKNAVSYLLTRDDVDPERVGLCCVCLGAGYGLEVAAFDRRVKAVALIAGAYNISDTYLGFLGADGFADYLAGLNDARQREFATGEVEWIDAVAGPPDYAPSSMPVQEAYEYYTRAHEREASRWQNRLTRASMEHLLAWNVVAHAGLITQPLLVVHGTNDVLLPPRFAQEVFDRAPDPKQLVWIETHDHVELYDQEPYVPQALAHVVPFLQSHLAQPATAASRSTGGEHDQ